MRLSAVKLAGFKSFVDPTVLHVHGSLTGVVGPNGCGKSNIIDAVRWVIGEMSAKQLRGEDMEDVIFNGSKDRKPVGRASVELIFDNSEGRFGDRYKDFAEISIKRELSRDGTSSYYLNNARCRRRDIIDLFLGTGLGGRNTYAIIEQGSINRFVQSRPEELRQILEEAAGISKYKERRRETETRIESTRDNLARLNDIRSELVQRLEQLKRQSANAEKFREFKQQERVLKAEVLALRWRSLGAEASNEEAALARAQGELTARQDALRASEAAREQQRAAQQEAGHACQSRQADYYAAEAEVSRVEQALRHARELQAARIREQESVQLQLRDLNARVDSEKSLREALQAEIAQLEVAVTEAEAAEAESRARHSAADQELHLAQERLELFSQDSQEPLRQAEGERVRVEQMQRQLEGVAERIGRLAQERAAMEEQPLADALTGADRELAELSTSLERSQSELGGLDVRVREQRDRRAELEGALHEARQSLQASRGRLASLEALQQAALREDDAGLVEWLNQHGWTSPKRLAQVLEVDPGWERAVEAALGNFLQALCIEGLDARLSGISGWPKVPLTLVNASDAAGAASGSLCVSHSLATRVRGPDAVLSLLSLVYAVESEADAAPIRSRLQPGQMLVTRTGLCYGPGWVQHPRGEIDEIGVIGREQSLRGLRQEVRQLEARASELEGQLGALAGELKSAEERRQAVAAMVDDLRHRHAEGLAMRQARSLKLEQMRARIRALDAELAELQAQNQQRQAETEAARQRLQAMLSTAEQLTTQRAALQDQMKLLRQAVGEAQTQREQAAETRQAAQLQLAGRRSAHQNVEQGLADLAGRILALDGQLQELGRQLAESGGPLEQQDALRQQVQARRDEAQRALEQARERLAAVEAEAGELAQRAQAAEAGVEAVREAAQQARLAFQTISVRRQALVEQINETGNSAESLCSGLADTATVEQWEENLAALDRRIQRLGPINLAAISEYEEQQQREAEIATQHADLTSALATLEEAIHKIDRETRGRFKETFDRVDGLFREAFAKLFKGGEASLDLTGEDMLDTGVRVMARPPGKRNSTIQQLSGGEKAMTAIALLFALFQLNPAPFCLLDEVDAPLDDQNTMRFCDLVRDMSERVQFIVITHNKITMEMAHHLHGVTMQEQGVSRLVSVDIDQAVAMVEEPARAAGGMA
jgi:chromosome segregation protein